MNKQTTILMAFFILFLFSGCVNKELVLDNPKVLTSQDNTWGQQTNVEENVDVSDLEKDLPVDTEIPTGINEEVPTEANEKMERVIFPTAEYRKLAQNGKGTVKGMIYVKDAYEKKVLGSNTRLYLNPVTTYSKQWYNESYIGGHKMQKADTRLFNYLRFTASDAGGNFAFYGVPSGEYYLIGTVKCGAQCGYDTAKSIRIATEVSILGNQIVQSDLSRMID